MDTAEDPRLTLAEELIASLDQGDENQSVGLLQELCRLSDCDTPGGEVYMEVGKLTREMHESINEFVNDTRMQSVAEDMPDARERLRHVIEMTERSAHTTMGSVETSLPMLAGLGQRAEDLNSMLATYYSRCDESNGLNLIREELTDFLTSVSSDTQTISGSMNEIMMAQGYQDLTGQVIQRVIQLVQDVEHGLIGILKVGSERASDGMTETQMKEADRKGHGPSVLEKDGNDVMQGQDDVDDLLSSLGF